MEYKTRSPCEIEKIKTFHWAGIPWGQEG